MSITQNNQLREEIALLGKMLGETVQEIAGHDYFQVIEEIRRLAWDGRRSHVGAESALPRYIASLPEEELRIVVRAFSLFLDLVNLAEDRQRVRVLNDRKRQAYPHGHNESIHQAIEQLKQSGKSSDSLQQLLGQLQIELVFTAHPTEAKRRAVRSKLRSIRHLLGELDTDQLPGARERTLQLIRVELAKLWQTDFIRPWRPSVMQEVERGLSIKPVLWDVLPQIMRDFRDSVGTFYPDSSIPVEPCISFGSWIGGDRDGHPGVTPEITQQTFSWLRESALQFHLTACNDLFSSLSISERQLKHGEKLLQAIEDASKQYPQTVREISSISPQEVCRRWIAVIRWRLQQTAKIPSKDDLANIALSQGAYHAASDLKQDVSLLLNAIAHNAGGEILAEELQTWIDRIDIFGFHLARLDVRQDARLYREVINELLSKLDLSPDPEQLDETSRQQLLLDSLPDKLQIETEDLSETTRESLDLFYLLHQMADLYGMQALGGHIMSMSSKPSDVLTVLWLWHKTAPGADDAPPQPLPIIPLFETIEDLQRGPEILSVLLEIDEYRNYLQRQNNRQMIMIGYSDSTKCGGYLSACWSLYEAQKNIHAVADRHSVKLTYFHGRGGSLGRGGGPAARGILSLPAGTFSGSLRLTEQGEVLADRYDDPVIAHRHLEQVLWSTLIACGEPPVPDQDIWVETMQQMASNSYHKYRELVELPNFVDFFRQVTPISEVENLPIGSRPARRRGSNSLDDLRAIPWVFSWTQSRCLIPAWYGIGSAVETFLADESQAADRARLLQSMYQNWPFFQATVDNAELALVKTDLSIAEHYANLADDSDTHTSVANKISEELLRTRKAILMITENEELLDGTPWLKESIRIRNRYIDPLNLIQVEMLRRSRSDAEKSEQQAEDQLHLTRLTIKGLAAGMRTSG